MTILDDSEFYESEEPFALHEYALLGNFVNQFLYRAIWSGALLGRYGTHLGNLPYRYFVFMTIPRYLQFGLLGVGTW